MIHWLLLDKHVRGRNKWELSLGTESFVEAIFFKTLFLPRSPDTEGCYLWHSPLTLLTSFTQPWHSPELSLYWTCPLSKAALTPAYPASNLSGHQCPSKEAPTFRARPCTSGILSLTPVYLQRLQVTGPERLRANYRCIHSIHSQSSQTMRPGASSTHQVSSNLSQNITRVCTQPKWRTP